jgi:hypothetical protein
MRGEVENAARLCLIDASLVGIRDLVRAALVSKLIVFSLLDTRQSNQFTR